MATYLLNTAITTTNAANMNITSEIMKKIHSDDDPLWAGSCVERLTARDRRRSAAASRRGAWSLTVATAASELAPSRGVSGISTAGADPDNATGSSADSPEPGSGLPQL